MVWTPNQMPSLAGRTAIVTGANGGIGFHTAKHLASQGAHVVMGCRNMSKAQQALEKLLAKHPTANAEVVHLDLEHLDKVNSFCDDFEAKHDRLDIIINNAGVLSPSHATNQQGHEVQFAINHLGHFALTGRLIPLLNESPNGRIVTVSSIAHRWGRIRFHDLQWEEHYNMWGAYGQSKLANLLFTFELERRLRSAGCSSSALAAHPGLTATDITRESSWMHKATPLVGQSADVGSWPSVRAATDLNVQGGTFWGPRWCFQTWGAPKRVGCSRTARDSATASRLWDVSEALTGVRFQFHQATP